jgi:hypothetical protein
MSEAKVKTSDGEVAKFTDGRAVLRARPAFEPIPGLNYTKPIHPDSFKDAFKVGLTIDEVNERLENVTSPDGVSIGTNLTDRTTVKKNRT